MTNSEDSKIAYRNFGASSSFSNRSPDLIRSKKFAQCGSIKRI